ncbi:hypothetical protein LZ554_005107 [Drepanopeziza brunnea f. sp. 'monogermtubi']|nr:hypothetical protein LZ554_005107 [Drepanopeziza brunnea f. sp. 'monogermtubi']
MFLPATLAVALLALLHIYIMILEMFLWTTPRGLRAFGLKPDFAEKTQTLAANQGLYNGFLAAGLLWSLVHPAPEVGRQLGLFFSGCVLVAGLYGGATTNRKIVFVQALPAGVAIAMVLLFA